MKMCASCKEDKPNESFSKDLKAKDGLQGRCKSCFRTYCKDNKKRLIAYQRSYIALNQTNLIAYRKEYYLKNKDRIKKKQKLWYSKNKHHIKIYEKNKRSADINTRLRQALRGRLSKFVRGQGAKRGSAIKELGCSVEYLKDHLASKFQENMSWSNYGKWHIDHIRPLSSFDLTNPEEFKQACHHTNLQPLWAADNIRKKNKYAN